MDMNRRKISPLPASSQVLPTTPFPDMMRREEWEVVHPELVFG